jgi:hypothetical protein
MNDLAEHRALRAAASAALLALIGTLLDWTNWRHLPRVPGLFESFIVAIVVYLGALAVLYARRERPPEQLAAVLFLCVVAAASLFSWFGDQGLAARNAYFVPFENNKVAALAIALVAPRSLWAGFGGIAIFVGSALIHFVLFPPGVRALMAFHEPVTTSIYGLFAIALLVVRLRSLASHEELVRIRAERALLDQNARIFLAIRDLANTPMQTISLVAYLMRTQKDADLAQLASRVERSLGKLRELNDLIEKARAAAQPHGGGTSFDALAWLRRRGAP